MDNRITLLQGDITEQKVDAIVNAANESLLGGGGVDGAIHQAAGPDLLKECRTIGGCPTGEARVTQGYRLLARVVIHTVGPIWHGGSNNEEGLLAECYRSVFAIVREKEITSVAFPAISTGVYRFPIPKAAEIAIRETRFALQENSQIEEVRFVCFDGVNLIAYQKVLGR